jgi:ribonuclease HI
MNPEYFVYTDGSCKAGERSPGGWGYCIRQPQGGDLEAHGSAIDTQAKVMEYTAVAEALAALPDGARATVFSDNQALVENCRKALEGWRQSGWRKVDPAIVELVKRIDGQIAGKKLSLTWQWVRGHRANSGNARADELAGQGAREAKAAVEKAERERRRSRFGTG